MASASGKLRGQCVRSEQIDDGYGELVKQSNQNWAVRFLNQEWGGEPDSEEDERWPARRMEVGQQGGGQVDLKLVDREVMKSYCEEIDW